MKPWSAGGSVYEALDDDPCQGTPDVDVVFFDNLGTELARVKTNDVGNVFAGPGALDGLKMALGPRDSPPPMGMRAERALANMQEALPVFLGLAVLHIPRGTPPELAGRGAARLSLPGQA